jgi:peptidoglycan hydrolase-like protein with peptidoglycan-binding domain
LWLEANVDRFINAYLAANPDQAGAGRRSRGPEPLIPEASIIRRVQWQLQEAGFDPGPVDGKMGTQTRLALRQYQTRQGLPTTGELDDATRRALGLK